MTGWQVGDRVVVNDAIPCGACTPCREGRLDGCEDLTMVGITHDGALAEYIKITAPTEFEGNYAQYKVGEPE